MSVRRTAAAAALAAAAGVAGLPALAPAPAVAATGSGATYRVPSSGMLELRGHGWGHGHGMSQYGAYGAAKERNLGYRQILAFYYPRTTLGGQPLSTTVRVLLHGTTGRQLTALPSSAGPLTVSTDVADVAPCTLPVTIDDQTQARAWRAKVVHPDAGPRLRLQVSDGSSWSAARPPGCDRAWRHPMDASISFDGGDVTRLSRSDGVGTYRGILRAAFTGSRIYVVNVVRMESYLRSVVPSEMPSSWAAAALQAQTVAARTYAAFEMAHPKNRPYYDVYDDTRDQMYVGARAETAATDAAITATQDAAAGTAAVLLDGAGNAAFTQFSSSDGGWTVSGGQPYLPAQEDPYDGLVPSSVHSWSTQVSAASIAARFREIGTLRAIVITDRDGNGDWGGRVTGLTLRGSTGRVSLTGAAFRTALGLRSDWFTVVAPPGRPTHVEARADDGSVAVSWQPPVRSADQVTGYRVVLKPARVVRKVPADSRSVQFADVSDTDATVTVAALSAAGRGRGSTVTTKVQRLAAGSRVATAVAVGPVGVRRRRRRSGPARAAGRPRLGARRGAARRPAARAPAPERAVEGAGRDPGRAAPGAGRRRHRAPVGKHRAADR